jgi:aerobic-type carbon monoxide dehydrogenase small subunit (CoxS/CutS family)
MSERREQQIEEPGHVELTFKVNGEESRTTFDSRKTLLEVLREDLGLTGTKHGCELGECGACAVLVDGEPLLSCLTLALECEGREITTIEGLSQDAKLHPLQEAFADLGGTQCGYCTPGILVTAKALVERNPDPSREQIREALSGCLCRCTGYQQIFESVEQAILTLRERKRDGE